MSKLIRPRQVKLKPSKSLFQHCQKLSVESARVWNAAKNFFWRTYRKKGIWLSEGAIKRYIKQRFALHSDSVQAVVEKFYANLKSRMKPDDYRLTARSLRKENPDIRYPYKNKKWFCIHWKKKAIKVEGRLIHLSNGRGRQGIVFKLPVELANCQPNTVELIWRNGYWLSITLEVEGKQQVLGFNTAAIDMLASLVSIHPSGTQPKPDAWLVSIRLRWFRYTSLLNPSLNPSRWAYGTTGEIHAITITDGEEAEVISGRELRSVKRYRNKTVGKLARKQSRCQKGSRRWKRLQSVKSKVIAECERRTRDLNHKITRLAVDWCIEHNVKTLVIGDVTGIAQNTKSEKRLNRKNRQKIGQWSFYKHRQYLEYKCDEVGIETTLESEKGTSKTCPQCGHKQKPNGRNYNCPACNLKIHRDVVGACNIRTKHLTGVLNGNDNFESPKVKYLRINDSRCYPFGSLPRQSLKSSSVAGVNRRNGAHRRSRKASPVCRTSAQNLPRKV